MSWYLHPELCQCRRIILKNIQRDTRQPVIFNIEIFVTTSDEKDDLNNAYNYDLGVAAVDHHINEKHIDLQETMVDKIADELLSDQRVKAVLVRSEKTQAYETVESAGIEIFRIRNA